MRLVLRSFCVLTMLAAVGGAQTASDPRDALLVSTAWLEQHLKDPNLTVLFIGDDNEYKKTHIPGAQNVQMEDFAIEDNSPTGLALEVPPTETLRNRLGALGITDQSRIVVSSGGRMFLAWTTRLLLTLDYAGFGDRTSLLDGGMPAWSKEHRPVTDVVPPKRTSALGALNVKPVIVNAAFVKSRIGKPGVSIVDARAQAFYDGVSTGSSGARKGHIAGAKSIPYTGAFGTDDFARPTAELQSIFSKAGVAPGDTVIGYCHIGQQATAMLFAARLLGHPVRLYDGSFQDWSRQPAAEFPVELPQGNGKP